MDEPTSEEVHSARLTLSDPTSSIEDVRWAHAVLARRVDATLPPEPGSAPLVKGTIIRLTRLDAFGKPTGEYSEVHVHDAAIVLNLWPDEEE